LALGLGAAIWCFTLVSGFVVVNGWASLIPGPISIASSYVVALWLVTLVLAPLLAFRNPVCHRAALDVYVPAWVLAVLGTTFIARLEGDLLVFLGGGVPIAAALTAGLVLWAHL
jgi:hypothetical protein